MDFATSILPGWHTTIFPPYFVSGAVFSGFAMVLTLMLIVRKVYKLEAYITVKHVEYMNIVIIVTGSIVGVAYLTELFMAWYSGVEWEQYAFLNRATGPMAWAYWIMMTCNVISPQLFWFKKLRTSLAFTFVLSIVVNIGMWFERFVIIVPTLCRTYLPSTWNWYVLYIVFTLFSYFPSNCSSRIEINFKSIWRRTKETFSRARTLIVRIETNS
jgi:molybdopterin-containing oxidoreductase family membrane subunit